LEYFKTGFGKQREKSGFTVNEKKAEFKTENRKVVEKKIRSVMMTSLTGILHRTIFKYICAITTINFIYL
jgi:hypothetical protein